MLTTPHGRFDPQVIECRRVLLEQYANAVMGTPALAKSAVMQAFLSSGVLPDSPASNTPSMPHACSAAGSHSPASDVPAGGAHVSMPGRQVHGELGGGSVRGRALSLGEGTREDGAREDTVSAARKSFASAFDA